jgi:hypothetical protein
MTFATAGGKVKSREMTKIIHEIDEVKELSQDDISRLSQWYADDKEGNGVVNVDDGSGEDLSKPLSSLTEVPDVKAAAKPSRPLLP